MVLSKRGTFLLLSSSELLGIASSDDGHDGGCGGSDHDDGHDEGEVNIVLGGNGSETLIGSTGRDVVYGYNGDDNLFGVQGADRLDGGNGNDLLDGGAGADNLSGGNGNDGMYGGKGKDVLFGDNGNDLLIGGCGPDVLNGGKGNDILDGGKVADRMTGGQGSDRFILRASHGSDSEQGSGMGHSGGDPGHEDEGITDVITDFELGADRIILSGLSYADLSFKDNSIFVKASNQVLAILSGVDTTELTAAHFL